MDKYYVFECVFAKDDDYFVKKIFAKKSYFFFSIIIIALPKIVFKKDTRERLSSDELDELQSIYNSFTLPDNLQAVLKYFLFACFTGLTWKDIVTLKYEDIEKKGNTYVIGKKRHKTKMHFVVPLIQKAKDLIDVEQKEGKVFPDMLSNQKSNVYIQRIIKNSKITKHITFHCVRHSFATVAMNSGIPREIVQRMLGHATEDQTRLYAKVLDTYIIDEMNKWDKSTNISDFKDNLDELKYVTLFIWTF
ncbi:MAG: integrase [Saprospiraceae bacterium]|jgi:integrase